MADLANNRKARFNYLILEKFEAGISLVGTEVKSCRAGHISIQEAFGLIENGEAYLVNARIDPYDQGNRNNHEPLRKRKLLLHKAEIKKIEDALNKKGQAFVPLNLYLTRGKIKIKMALGKGKNVVDKRDTLKKRQDDIDMKRAMAHKNR